MDTADLTNFEYKRQMVVCYLGLWTSFSLTVKRFTEGVKPFYPCAQNFF